MHEFIHWALGKMEAEGYGPKKAGGKRTSLGDEVDDNWEPEVEKIGKAELSDKEKLTTLNFGYPDAVKTLGAKVKANARGKK